MKKMLSLLIALLASANLFAQEVEMADALRADGKIYVVVAVLSVVLAGILFYVIRLYRKITRLEKENGDK
jgi:uncharacterized integral membrane protein